MDWRSKAACLDKDPELFFPVGNTGPALLQIEEAKAVCRSCEVVDTCLKWAMESGQDSGVWGGMSEDERRAMKRRAARARHRTPRAQFYVFEIARNRLGLNDKAHEIAKEEAAKEKEKAEKEKARAEREKAKKKKN